MWSRYFQSPSRIPGLQLMVWCKTYGRVGHWHFLTRQKKYRSYPKSAEFSRQIIPHQRSTCGAHISLANNLIRNHCRASPFPVQASKKGTWCLFSGYHAFFTPRHGRAPSWLCVFLILITVEHFRSIVTGDNDELYTSAIFNFSNLDQQSTYNMIKLKR